MSRSLADILKAEGDALVAGRFDLLEALARQRDDAVAALAGQETDDSELRTLAARNMRLAEAAAAGLRKARRRLAQIAGGSTLETYSAAGKRQAFRDIRPSLHRRA